MILTLLLSTTKVTPDQVLQAMETIHLTDVNTWSQEVFGQSILSKRKLAFSTGKNYMKVALFFSDRWLQNQHPSDRVYHCERCNLILDRDLNSAINLKLAPEKHITNRAGSVRIYACGHHTADGDGKSINARKQEANIKVDNFG